jgi:hypothetical protein
MEMLNIDEVGQGFNHLEWAAGSLNGERVLGLIIVSLRQKRISGHLAFARHVASQPTPFRQLYDDFLQMLSALQRLTPLQRIPELQAVALRAEWQPDAIFKRVARKQPRNDTDFVKV